MSANLTSNHPWSPQMPSDFLEPTQKVWTPSNFQLQSYTKPNIFHLLTSYMTQNDLKMKYTTMKHYLMNITANFKNGKCSVRDHCVKVSSKWMDGQRGIVKDDNISNSSSSRFLIKLKQLCTTKRGVAICDLPGHILQCQCYCILSYYCFASWRMGCHKHTIMVLQTKNSLLLECIKLKRPLLGKTKGYKYYMLLSVFKKQKLLILLYDFATNIWLSVLK